MLQFLAKYFVFLLSHLTLKLFPLALMAHKTGGTIVVNMVLLLIFVIICVVLSEQPEQSSAF